MKLWRISNYTDLRGIGGIKTPGRWHNRGIPVVYLSQSPALAMLEVLVHFELDSENVPSSYQLLEVDYSERKGVSRLSDSALPDNWREDEELTRTVGDEWLSRLDAVLLRVPSAVVPKSYNYLFSPRHPFAKKVRVTSAIRHPYDYRLMP